MNWSDERYVKVYTRDTLTWLSLGFEARAVLALLLRKVNGAGIMETGTIEAARAVAMQIVAPVDVVRTGLAELVAIGTVEMVPNGVLLPNFVEAQEATKTESRKKADQRQRDRDQRRQAQLVETLEADVPRSPAVSRAVPLQPSPAQLTTSSPPAQPSPPPAQRDQPRSKKPKAQAELPEIIPPAPPREPSRGEVLFEKFGDHRQEHLEELGSEPTPDASYAPAYVNKVFKTWFELWADVPFNEKWLAAGITTGAEVRCIALFEAYFGLDWPAKCVARVDGKNTDTPQPYPFSALASEKVWRPLVAELWPDEQLQAGAA